MNIIDGSYDVHSGKGQHKRRYITRKRAGARQEDDRLAGQVVYSGHLETYRSRLEITRLGIRYRGRWDEGTPDTDGLCRQHMGDWQNSNGDKDRGRKTCGWHGRGRLETGRGWGTADQQTRHAEATAESGQGDLEWSGTGDSGRDEGAGVPTERGRNGHGHQTGYDQEIMGAVLS